jgi:hypothetical protein
VVSEPPWANDQPLGPAGALVDKEAVDLRDGRATDLVEAAADPASPASGPAAAVVAEAALALSAIVDRF